MDHPTQEIVMLRRRVYGMLTDIGDVLTLRARDRSPEPILGIPRFENDASDYELFTAEQLNQMVNSACWILEATFERSVQDDVKTVALLARSDLSFVVVFFALIRMGYQVLVLYPQLQIPACIDLLLQTHCDIVIFGKETLINKMIAGVSEKISRIRWIPMFPRSRFDHLPSPSYLHDIRARRPKSEVALIFPSSRSTGCPKPVFVSRKGLILSLEAGDGMKSLNTLPWHHVHGLITSLQAMWMRQTAYLMNSFLPTTAANVIAALESTKPEAFHSDPSLLESIAEHEGGLDALRICKVIMCRGASIPSRLATQLTRVGKPYGASYELTEVGLLGDSLHGHRNDRWPYIRWYANVREFLELKKRREDLHELVILPQYPGLLKPDFLDRKGPLYTNDLFTPHPTIPHAWKHVAHEVDELTLSTGERMFPLEMERCIRSNGLVEDCLMIGTGHLIPGMLVFPHPDTARLSRHEYIRGMSASIKSANRFAERFTRLEQYMILVMEPGLQFPVIEDGSISRTETLCKFAREIETFYRSVGIVDEDFVRTHCPGEQMSDKELQSFLYTKLARIIGVRSAYDDTNLFPTGPDRLSALLVRNNLQRALHPHQLLLPENIVLEKPTIRALASHLYALRAMGGQPSLTNGRDFHATRPVVEKYSAFIEPTARDGNKDEEADDRHIVVLVGATESLGAHILAELLNHPLRIDRVICLIRAGDKVMETLRQCNLHERINLSLDRMECWTWDLAEPFTLGLSSLQVNRLRTESSLFIDASWPLDYTHSVSPFESQIFALQKLLSFALANGKKFTPRFLFVSTVLASSLSLKVRSPLDGTSYSTVAEPNCPGWVCAKWIGEQICTKAAQCGGTAIEIAVVQIPQLIGDTTEGIWNEEEAIPWIVQSALNLKVLPKLDCTCEWVPVDTAARFIVKAILKHKCPDTDLSLWMETFHSRSSYLRRWRILGSYHFDWNDGFLPALKEAGLRFEPVPFHDWIAELQKTAQNFGVDARWRLPAIRLLGYYWKIYEWDAQSREAPKMKAPYDITSIESFRDTPDAVGNELITKFVQVWMEKWMRPRM